MPLSSFKLGNARLKWARYPARCDATRENARQVPRNVRSAVTAPHIIGRENLAVETHDAR